MQNSCTNVTSFSCTNNILEKIKNYSYWKLPTETTNESTSNSDYYSSEREWTSRRTSDTNNK
jgi:hypothetical protein